MSYLNFIKHTEKLTKGVVKSRPALGCVYIDGSGEMFSTDAVCVYTAKGFVESGEERTLDIKTMHPSDYPYPKIKNVIPNLDDSSYTAKLSLNAKELVSVLEGVFKCAKASGGDFDWYDQIIFSKSGVEISAGDFTASLLKVVKMPEDTILALSRLIAGMKYLKDMGATDVTINYFGHHKPVVFTALKGDIRFVILPIAKRN